MKDQNRADEWSDQSKSRLFGFLKYRRNRKMKNDRYSKSRLRDIHIKNMKTDEEFVTEFSVDGKYKDWLKIFVTQKLVEIKSMESYTVERWQFNSHVKGMPSYAILSNRIAR